MLFCWNTCIYGRHCFVDIYSSRTACIAPVVATPGSGDPWEWRPMGVATHGSGDPKPAVQWSSVWFWRWHISYKQTSSHSEEKKVKSQALSCRSTHLGSSSSTSCHPTRQSLIYDMSIFEFHEELCEGGWSDLSFLFGSDLDRTLPCCPRETMRTYWICPPWNFFLSSGIRRTV